MKQKKQVVVVLDASYQPLNIVPLRRALGYLWQGKASVVEASDEVPIGFTLPDGIQGTPKVIAFNYAVPWRWGQVVAWSRQRMLERDNWTCAYCGGHGRTVDHIMPQSRGGEYSWMNTVTACGPCNNRKADRTPEEANMPLLFQPFVLTRRELFKRQIAAAGVTIDWL